MKHEKENHYWAQDGAQELRPEHAHLPRYRGTYCFEYNPKGHGMKATLVFPAGTEGFWLIANFDEQMNYPEGEDPTPAGVWITFSREAFQIDEEPANSLQDEDVKARFMDRMGLAEAQTELLPSAAQQILDLIMEECRYWHGRDEARRGNFANLYAAAKELADNAAPIAQTAPAQVTAAMWKAAHDSMESDGDLALALQEALNAAHGQTATQQENDHG